MLSTYEVNLRSGVWKKHTYNTRKTRKYFYHLCPKINMSLGLKHITNFNWLMASLCGILCEFGVTTVLVLLLHLQLLKTLQNDNV